MTSSCDRYVCLSSGLALPLEPLRLLWDLEDRGLDVARDGEDHLRVRPANRLTNADKAALARWKTHLLTLIALSDHEVVQ